MPIVEQEKKPMTEPEIIAYLKANRDNCQIYAAFPKEVKSWCESMRTSKISENFEFLKEDGTWGRARLGEKSNFLNKNVYSFKAKYTDYRNMTGQWAERPIDANGKFNLQIPANEGKADLLSQKEFYWWDWAGARTYIEEHNLPYSEFGGWQYDKQWVMRPALYSLHSEEEQGGYFSDHCKDGKESSSRPCAPKKIRFWLTNR